MIWAMVPAAMLIAGCFFCFAIAAGSDRRQTGLQACAGALLAAAGALALAPGAPVSAIELASFCLAGAALVAIGAALAVRVAEYGKGLDTDRAEAGNLVPEDPGA